MKDVKRNSELIWFLLDYEKPAWELSCPQDSRFFYKELYRIAEDGSILYLEDGSWDNEIRKFFEKNQTDTSIIPGGTLWPKPKASHLPITKDILSQLADIQERHAEPEIATHIHIYKGRNIILQWYDAFSDPIYIDGSVPEWKIEKFCKALKIIYKKKKGV